MTPEQIAMVVQDAIYTIILVSAPLLLVGLVVGVAVSIFQATTQINEQTLVFVPKVVSILITLIIFGPWMMARLTDFTTRLYTNINIMMR